VQFLQGLAALQPRVQSLLGRLGGAAAALVLRPATHEAVDRATSRRWDAQDRLGLRLALSGMEDAVLWLDSLLPLVSLACACEEHWSTYLPSDRTHISVMSILRDVWSCGDQQCVQ
jgi:hypothetical protein